MSRWHIAEGSVGKRRRKRNSARSHERHKRGPLPTNIGNYRYGEGQARTGKVADRQTSYKGMAITCPAYFRAGFGQSVNMDGQRK